MRRVYALLRLVRRYGEARVDAPCATALEHEMLNIKRLETLLKHAEPPALSAPPRVLPPARYLRDPRQYVLLSLRAEDHQPQPALSIGAPTGEIR